MSCYPPNVFWFIGICMFLGCSERDLPQDSNNAAEQVCRQLCHKAQLCKDGSKDENEDECFDSCMNMPILKEDTVCGEAQRVLVACFGNLSCEARALRLELDITDQKIEYPCGDEILNSYRRCP